MNRNIAVVLLAVSPAAAQIVNGSFETGALTPWVVTSTPGGGTITSSLSLYDIDGAGPLPPSQAATFMVGRLSPGTAPEGIIISQSIPLTGGSDYTFSFNWSAHALVNVYNSSAGTFELLIDGAVLNQGVAPTLPQGQRAYGQVAATFHAPMTRNYTIAIRISRTVLRGEEVFQYLDHITAVRPCYANCDGSTGTPLLTANDFQCFFNAYVTGQSYANCDVSSGTPILTANDFTCFIGLYAQGCS